MTKLTHAEAIHELQARALREHYRIGTRIDVKKVLEDLYLLTGE